MAMMFQPLVQEYGMASAVTRSPTMLAADGVTTVLISTPVQLFIAWRIKIISSSLVMPSIIAFFSFCSFVGGIATTICVSLIPEYARLHEFDGAPTTWLTSSAIADIIITVTLVISLRRCRTDRTSTNDVLDRIIRLTIQTGAITAIFAILDAAIFLGKRHTSLNFAWDFPLGKLYTNSLLSTLNARAGWSQAIAEQQQDNVLFRSSRPPSKSPQSKTARHSDWNAVVSDVWSLEKTDSLSSEQDYRTPIEFRSTGHGNSTDRTKSSHDMEFGVVITKTTEQKTDPL
ncbi:hypothetical protein BU17DRAFT_79789 [Hysterangium stoloniferum]|nr:hypothetical protein BU17DRAFT_79789 [Hysterangium stoloniferum]